MMPPHGGLLRLDPTLPNSTRKAPMANEKNSQEQGLIQSTTATTDAGAVNIFPTNRERLDGHGVCHGCARNISLALPRL